MGYRVIITHLLPEMGRADFPKEGEIGLWLHGKGRVSEATLGSAVSRVPFELAKRSSPTPNPYLTKPANLPSHFSKIPPSFAGSGLSPFSPPVFSRTTPPPFKPTFATSYPYRDKEVSGKCAICSGPFPHGHSFYDCRKCNRGICMANDNCIMKHQTLCSGQAIPVGG